MCPLPVVAHSFRNGLLNDELIASIKLAPTTSTYIKNECHGCGE
jgi:hypothetical protein